MESRVNNKYSHLPAGWEVKTVEQVFDFYPTASYSRDKMFKDNNPSAIGYIHYGDIHTKYNLILDVPNTEIPYISEELKKDFEYIKEGDLILSDTSEDYDGVGKCIEILNVGNNKIISGLHTLMLRPKGNDLIDGFKGYLFSGEYVRNSLLRIVTGIKVYSIAKAMLAKVNLPIPSIQEQKEITNILSKVDKAIASVQNSIAVTERLKKSLMQNLLTGKMKPDGTFRTSKEFYIDEKFGKVPVGWEVKKGTEITTKITKGQSPKWQGFDYQQEGILFVTSENIQNGYIDISKPKYLPLEFNNKIKNSQLKKGDILINIVGASIGRCAIFNIDVECANTNQAVCVFRPNAENDSMFLSLYLQSETTQNRLFRTQVETARANLSLGDFRKFKFVIPQKEEQINIANRINQFNIEIEKQVERINVLERLKKSLMQNLLTGKIKF